MKFFWVDNFYLSCVWNIPILMDRNVSNKCCNHNISTQKDFGPAFYAEYRTAMLPWFSTGQQFFAVRQQKSKDQRQISTLLLCVNCSKTWSESRHLKDIKQAKYLLLLEMGWGAMQKVNKSIHTLGEGRSREGKTKEYQSCSQPENVAWRPDRLSWGSLLVKDTVMCKPCHRSVMYCANHNDFKIPDRWHKVLLCEQYSDCARLLDEWFNLLVVEVGRINAEAH